MCKAICGIARKREQEKRVLVKNWHHLVLNNHLQHHQHELKQEIQRLDWMDLEETQTNERTNRCESFQVHQKKDGVERPYIVQVLPLWNVMITSTVWTKYRTTKDSKNGRKEK